jgi:DNA-binding MarR family transcriptional regulator
MTADNLAPPDREEWASLYAAFAILRKETDRALSDGQVTVFPRSFPQVAVLALLAEAERPLPVTRIARLLLQESSSVSNLVDRMCERGLVERVKDPRDRRVVLVTLTDLGRRLHDDARSSAAAVSNELFGVLSAKERATLRGLLQKFTRRNIQRLG